MAEDDSSDELLGDWTTEESQQSSPPSVNSPSPNIATIVRSVQTPKSTSPIVENNAQSTPPPTSNPYASYSPNTPMYPSIQRKPSYSPISPKRACFVSTPPRMPIYTPVTQLAPENPPNTSILRHFVLPEAAWFQRVMDVTGITVNPAIAAQRWGRFLNPLRLPAKPRFLESVDGPSIQSGWRIFAQVFTGNPANWEKFKYWLSQRTLQVDRSLNRHSLAYSQELITCHLSVLSMTLCCRIGIFDGVDWTLIGDWNNVDPTPIVLLEQQQVNNEFRLIIDLF